MDQRAVAQPQDDDVGIIRRQKLSALRRHRQRLTAPAGRVDEDAAQIASPVAALLHAQRHALAELGKLPHLYACAERTGAKHEPEALIGIAGIGLDIADDSEIEQRSEEHTSELQSLLRISYAVFCMKKKHTHHHYNT